LQAKLWVPIGRHYHQLLDNGWLAVGISWRLVDVLLTLHLTWPWQVSDWFRPLNLQPNLA
jgi:hypothetical protein